MTKFKQGQKYLSRFIGDQDATMIIEILKRTAKSVWIEHPHTNEETRKSIKYDLDGNEYILPLGSYSMAPKLSAERIVI